MHLILHELAWAYKFFIGCYSLIENNYLRNNVFQNAAIVRSGKDNMLLDSNFFGKKFYTANKNRIRKLTFEDCFTDGKFKSINEFAESVGIRFPPLTWMNLQTAITYAKKYYPKQQLMLKKDCRSVILLVDLRKAQSRSDRLSIKQPILGSPVSTSP